MSDNEVNEELRRYQKQKEERIQEFAKSMMNKMPLFIAIGIAIFWIFYGTVEIIPTNLTIVERIGLTLCTIALAVTYCNLIADGSLKSAGSVVDEITPNNAIKRVDEILGSTYENAITTATTSAGLKCVVIQTNITFVNADTQNIAVKNNLGLTAMPASSQWTTTAINVIAFNRSKRILINFSQTLTDEEIIAKAKTLILNFAILTPIEANIDLSQLTNIEGHSNGSVTAQNTYDMPVQSEIDYLFEEVKA